MVESGAGPGGCGACEKLPGPVCRAEEKEGAEEDEGGAPRAEAVLEVLEGVRLCGCGGRWEGSWRRTGARPGPGAEWGGPGWGERAEGSAGSSCDSSCSVLCQKMDTLGAEGRCGTVSYLMYDPGGRGDCGLRSMDGVRSVGLVGWV